MTEILEHEFDDLNFIHFLPDIILETVHSFLHEARLTMMSIRALSDFLTLSFSVLVAYIFKLTIMMMCK